MFAGQEVEMQGSMGWMAEKIMGGTRGSGPSRPQPYKKIHQKALTNTNGRAI
jgi:hypothetical protein